MLINFQRIKIIHHEAHLFDNFFSEEFLFMMELSSSKTKRSREVYLPLTFIKNFVGGTICYISFFFFHKFDPIFVLHRITISCSHFKIDCGFVLTVLTYSTFTYLSQLSVMNLNSYCSNLY